jgi:uncharacterized phiE125 gp8 family phage protein
MGYCDPSLQLNRKTGSLIAPVLPKDGNREWIVSVEPETEPVSVDELKEFARIDYDEEDTLLEGFIKAVRQASEEYMGRALIEQTIEMTMDYWPSNQIELPRPPLISIVRVATLDEDDTETAYSSDNYFARTRAAPGQLIIKRSITPPINTDRDYGGFLIVFKAGYGTTAASVPQSIREGIKLWASIVESTRELNSKNPPKQVRAFLDLYRLGRMIVR